MRTILVSIITVVIFVCGFLCGSSPCIRQQKKVSELKKSIVIKDLVIEKFAENYVTIKNYRDRLIEKCDSLEDLRVQAMVFTQRMKLNPPHGTDN